MKIVLDSTSTIDTIQGTIPARVWEGQTETGVPVKVWIPIMQPQTHDPALLDQFAAELREIPAKRELASFDMRLAL